MQLSNQSCGSSTVCNILQLPVGGMWSQWFGSWHDSWYQTGWFSISKTAPLQGFSPTTVSEWLLRMITYIKNIQRPDVLLTEMPRWCERSMENGQTGWSWQTGYSNTENHRHCCDQRSISELEFLVCQQRLSCWDCRGNRLAKTGQLKTGKTQPGLMNLHFCRGTQMAGQKWRQQHDSMVPTCCVSTVQAGGGGVMVRGRFPWHTLAPLLPISHRLNTTFYSSTSPHGYNVPFF